MEQKKPKKQTNSDNKKGGLGLSAAFFAVTAIIIVAVILIAAYFITTVRTITVAGNSVRSGDSIINLSGLYTGKNIFTYDLKTAKRNIEKDPYLKCESVRAVLPSTISIVVTERREFAAILLGGGSYCVIDRTGLVLDIDRTEESVGGLLPIYGLGSMGFTVGTRIDDDGGKLRPYTVMQMLDSIGDRIVKIRCIDISNSSSVKVITVEGVTVMLGDSVNIPSKIDRMFRALEKVDPAKAETAIVYVNSTGTTDLSYPTPIPETTPEPIETEEPDPEAGETGD